MIALLTLTLIALSAGTEPAGGRVTWKGKKYQVEELPADMPVPATEAVQQWSAWAVERDYRLTLDAEGRVLLVSATSVDDELELVARTVQFFDARLLAPPREKIATLPLLGGGGLPEDPDDVIPEDPDEEGGGSGSLDRALYGWTETWGAGTQELDRDTITLLVLDGESDYGEAIEHLATLAPYLDDWKDEARENLGFVLEKPLCGAWVHGGAGQEEWSPDGELVHRLSELLLARRFGRQPYWLIQGWAWHAETELRGAIYCYPYRSEFVYTVEHAAWPDDLKRLGNEPGGLDLEEVLGLARGHWDGRAARLAFGTAAFLAREHAEALPLVLEDLRLAWDQGNRTDLGGGQWRRDPDWEAPLARQIEILQRHAGADFLSALTESLRAD